MQRLLIVLCSLSIVAADVSHLFGHHNQIDDHHHHHHASEHDHSHEHQHKGYSYERPSIPFVFPKPVETSYLPPQEYLPPVIKATTTARPTLPPQEYLPPTVTTKRPAPLQEYLPPITTTKSPPLPPRQEYLPPVTTTRRPTTPPPSPKLEYLPPAALVQRYQIPIPNYAEILETNYLPPVVHENVNENLHDDGYHYDKPAKPFFY